MIRAFVFPESIEGLSPVASHSRGSVLCGTVELKIEKAMNSGNPKNSYSQHHLLRLGIIFISESYTLR